MKWKLYFQYIGPALFLCAYYFLLSSYPTVVTDEPWYANTAYNFKNGLGLINTSTGWRGGDELFLYTVMLGGWFKIFGTSLLSGRAMSVVLGALSVWGCYHFAKSQNLSKLMTAVLVALFSVSNLVFIVARRIRPEIVVLCCLVWGIVWMSRALQKKSFKMKPLLMAFALFFVSSFSHPLGAYVTVSAGLSFLLLPSLGIWDKVKATGAITFLCTALIAFYVFLWGLFKDVSFIEFIRVSVFESKRLTTTGGFFDTFYTNWTFVFPSYVLGVKRFFIVAVEAVVLAYGLTIFRRSIMIRFLSWMALIFILGTFFTMHYFFRVGFVFPHVILLMTLVLMSHHSYYLVLPRWRYFMLAVVLAYGCNHLAGDVWMLWKHRYTTPYSVIETQLDAAIPDHTVVLTHLPFWFALKSNRIFCNNTYFSSTPYSGITDPNLVDQFEYAVVTDAFSTGISPTTGEKELLYGLLGGPYYNQVMEVVSKKGAVLINTLTFPGYGTIRVYQF